MESQSSRSGAARKRRKRLLEEQKLKLPKITSFFQKSSSALETNHPSSQSGNGFVDQGEQNYSSSSASETEDNTVDMDTPGQPEEVEEELEGTRIESMEPSESQGLGLHIRDKNVNIEQFLKTIEAEKYPTDKANFKDTILTDELKRFIIAKSPCQPHVAFPKDTKNRSFSIHYYKAHSQSGISTPRKWLCYSVKENKAYCEPCWLFSKLRVSFGDGTSDWQSLSKKIAKHSSAASHIMSCYIFDQWKTSKGLDSTMNKTLREKSNFWRQVLYRLIDITLGLAKNMLAFRGHSENISDTYNGNFLTQVNLLAKYDSVMKELIMRPKGTINYLSPTIQNELIQQLGNTLQELLISKINGSPFFTLIADTTQDISKIDQMSLIIRYVEIEVANGESKMKIKETFLGFFKIEDQSAYGMASKILQYTENMGLDIKKCRGQGYDGASVMSGSYSGVQKRINDVAPKATYIHCAAHNLNLAINDSVRHIEQIDAFFLIIGNVYTFFGLSIKRWDLLASINTGERESAITLKKLNPTRWASRATSLLAVNLRYLDIIKALIKINLTSNKRDERDEAKRLQKSLENFEFIFILKICTKIFAQLSSSSEFLQSREIDLFQASKYLKSATKKLEEYRNNYDTCKEEAEKLAQSWHIDAHFEEKRQHRPKIFFDENPTAHLFSTREHYFKINIYNALLDTVINQLRNRFQNFYNIIKAFQFLNPNNFVNLSEDELIKNSEFLQKLYPEDISTGFTVQILLLVPLSTDIKNCRDILDFGNFLLKNDTLSSNFPDVVTALILFLTLPVTVATAERSFSRLKLIKNQIRSTMMEDRLNSLALLAIEAEEAASMDLDNLVSAFADSKARRKDFS